MGRDCPDPVTSMKALRSRLQCCASGQPATLPRPCAISETQWDLVKPVSTTPSATNGRSSRGASTAIRVPICVPALPASNRHYLRAKRSNFLAEIVERSLESRLGCLLVNSALEVAPHDPDIADIVAARMGELEAFFRRCVIAGQRDSSISPDADAKDVARLLLTTVTGLRVLAPDHPERAVLEGAARQALSTLGKPDRERKPSARTKRRNIQDDPLLFPSDA